jgi:periplasmic protein TonB
MGYQALLFCPDEKLALLLSQLFGELDFRVEVVNEPFAAVKKLMAQHYDALVVDIDNEQNASLLFKSARNSGSNHSSLAIAMVAGQAGITKAYRIGANLVLTKPINVEQTKGTLRVARGLLRKNSEAAGGTAAGTAAAPAPANPGTPILVAAPGSSPSDRRKAPRLAFSSISPEASEFGSSPSPEALTEDLPGAFPATATAMVDVEHKPAMVQPAATSNRIKAAADATLPASKAGFSKATGAVIDHRAVESGVARKLARSETDGALSATPAANMSSAIPSSTGSATAPTPAPEVNVSGRGANRVVESEATGPSHKHPSGRLSEDSTPGHIFSSEPANDSPLFAGVSDASAGMSSNKKMLIAAVIVLALAALGYFGYGMYIKSLTPAVRQSVNLPQSPAPPTAAADPQPSPMPEPSTGKPTGTTAATTTAAASTTPAQAAPSATSSQPLASPVKPPVISIAANESANPAPADELEIKKPSSKPLRVKSNGSVSKTQPTEDPAPQLPETVAAAGQENLSGVMSSSPSSVPRMALATIKISQGVSEGLLIKRVQPRYPRTTLLAHTEGTVQIEATINKEGFVKHPKVLKGDPVLGRAALDAVSQWRYKPYYLDGAPVEIQTQITVNFKPN